ncbi:MAG: hypothetical protein WAM00_07855 [Salegentibacter sp.]
MKKSITTILYCLAALLIFSCTKDDELASVDVALPSDISANFQIKQDNSGEVTIYPSAQGANQFTVDYGDGSEVSDTILPGDYLSHTYAEGNYDVLINAININGEAAQGTQNLEVSFLAPENLEVAITRDAAHPFVVNVQATADNAASFEVYFGDATDEEATPMMTGETVTHEYADKGTYTIRVVALSGGAATTEYTEDVTIEGATAPIELPITFDDETVNYAFGTFNGASFEVVDNPDVSGANATDSKVGAITNSGVAYEGGSFALGTPVDFSGDNKTITMKVWSDVALPVLLKFEGGVNGERQTEVSATHNGTGWEELTFNFATDAVKSYIDGSQGVGEPFVPTGQYESMVLFIDGPGETAGTFYIDDIAQTSVPKPEFPITFESAEIDYTWSGFGASDFGAIPAEVVDNPDQSGIGTSDKVVKIEKPAGAQTWAGASMDLAGPVDFSNGTYVKMKVWSPRAGTPILFKMEDSTSPKDGNGNPTVFFEVQATTTVANAWEELTFDLTTYDGFSTDIPYDRVIIFPDFNNPGNGEVFYFDDLFLTDSPDGEMTGGGEVATEPTAAAAAPTAPEGDVISLFSDAYTNVPVATWHTDWSNATLEEVTVDGNAVKKYSAMDFVGIETTNPTVDASDMNYFHTDFWTADATEIRIKLVDFGANGVYDGGGDDVEHEITISDPAQGQWVSVDVPMSDFSGLTTRAHIAQLIYSGNPTGDITVFVDNVYFHK